MMAMARRAVRDAPFYFSRDDLYWNEVAICDLKPKQFEIETTNCLIRYVAARLWTDVLY